MKGMIKLACSWVSLIAALLCIAPLALVADPELGATIRGTVTAMVDGTPLEAIDVQAYRWAGGWWQQVGWDTTVADGTYEISGLEAGTYRIGFSDWPDEQYVAQMYGDPSARWPGDGGMDVPIASGDSVNDIDAAPELGATIRGTVTAMVDGTPLEDIYVQAYSRTGDWWQQVGWGMTAADGTYELSGLRAGTYRVGFFDWSDEEYVSQMYGDPNAQWPRDGGTELSIAPGDSVNDIDAALLKYAMLSGRITESDGVTPVPNVWVFVPEIWRSTRSNADGEYSLDRIPPGAYPILAEPPAGSGLLAQWYQDVLSVEPYWQGIPDGVTLKTLGSGEHGAGIDFRLPRAARLEGRITSDGVGLTPARVKVRNVTYERTYYAEADEAGDYAVTGLLPGDVRVKAEVYGYQDEWWENANHEDVAQIVTLGLGDARTFDFDLLPGQSRAFVEVTSDLPGAEIFIDFQPTGQVTPAILDVGQLMPVASHTVLVTVRKDGYALPGVQWADAIEAETHQAHFELAAAQSLGTGSVRVSTVPEVGAEIFIDFGDAPAGVTPVTVGNLMTDYHLLVLRAPDGYLQPAPINFIAMSNEVTDIVVPMHLLTSEAERLTIEVNSDPGAADIYLDYLPSGQVTDVIVDWLDGEFYAGSGWYSASHTIMLRKPNFLPTTAYPASARHGVDVLSIALIEQVSDVVMNPSDGEVVETRRPAFTWTATAGATWYQLMLHRDGSTHLTHWVQADTWLPGVDLPAGHYQWWVRGWGPGIGFGEWSGAADFTVPAMRPATAPPQTGPTGEITDTRRPVFAWDAVAHAVWYRVFVQRVGGGAVLDRWTQETTLTPPSNLAAGTYRWWIVAWGPDGFSPWSGAMEFTIPSRAPGAITLIGPEGAQESHDLTYRWEQDANATWYRLWVGRAGAGTWHDGWHAFTGAGTAAVELANHPAGTFTWWLRPWGPDGFGPWSGPGQFTTPSQDPTEPQLMAPLGETFENPPTLAWESERADWYRVYVQRVGSGAVIDQWTAESHLTPAAALPAGQYAWWVGAWNRVTGRVVWSQRGDFTIQDE